MELSLREPIARAAALAAATVPVSVPEGADLGMGEFGPDKYFICWWGNVELDAMARALEGLGGGRFDAVADA